MNVSGKIKQIFSLAPISKGKHYFVSILVIGMVVFVCSPLSGTQNYHIVSFILLFVVSILATFLGIGPVLLASTFSSLVWNYFFIPPQFTFHIEKAEDILMFAMFFIIAFLNGILTTRIRRQEILAREREARTNALFLLTKELSKTRGIEEILMVGIKKIKDYFLVDSFFLLQDGNNKLNPAGRLQNGEKLSRDEFNIACRVFEQSFESGKLTDTQPFSEYTYYPLLGTRLNPGVVAVKPGKLFGGDRKVFWDTFLSQITAALEREFLGELAQKARVLDESDRLYKTLFNSISHELRIPVAAILGASDTLLSSSHPENIKSALFNEIFTASLRLNRLIENLLNISRLESGRISVRLDWHDINDLVNKVAEDLNEELKPFSLAISIPDEMPLSRIDFGLMEQVLYNLLFNSCQYAPATSEIELNISHRNGELILQVLDRGPGFSEEEMKNVFNKFFRAGSSKTGGLGLGLSIVKGFTEAHKGFVSVENREGGGAVFTIVIPSGNPEMNNLSFEKE